MLALPTLLLHLYFCVGDEFDFAPDVIPHLSLYANAAHTGNRKMKWEEEWQLWEVMPIVILTCRSQLISSEPDGPKRAKFQVLGIV